MIYVQIEKLQIPVNIHVQTQWISAANTLRSFVYLKYKFLGEIWGFYSYEYEPKMEAVCSSETF